MIQKCEMLDLLRCWQSNVEGAELRIEVDGWNVYRLQWLNPIEWLSYNAEEVSYIFRNDVLNKLRCRGRRIVTLEKFKSIV